MRAFTVRFERSILSDDGATFEHVLVHTIGVYRIMPSGKSCWMMWVPGTTTFAAAVQVVLGGPTQTSTGTAWLLDREYEALVNFLNTDTLDEVRFQMLGGEA